MRKAWFKLTPIVKTAYTGFIDITLLEVRFDEERNRVELFWDGMLVAESEVMPSIIKVALDASESAS